MRIIVANSESLMDQFSELIAVVSMIHKRAEDENYVSKTVVSPRKHTKKDLWWFREDDMLQGVSDYSRPQIILVIDLIDKISAAHELADKTIDVIMKPNIIPLLEPLLVLDVDDLAADGWIETPPDRPSPK